MSRAVKDAEYYAKKRERILANKAAYRRANLERLRAKELAWRSRNPEHVIISRMKSRATKKGWAFDLTVDAIEWHANCPCCDVEMRYGGTGSHAPNSATIDRLNSYRGYTQDNVWVICYRCNTLKNTGTPAELRCIADAVDRVIASRASS